MASRLRARLASSEDDRFFQRHLADAERSLKLAGDVCQSLIRQARDDRTASARAQSALQTINQTVRAISSIGHLSSVNESTDSDLVSEETRILRFREQEAKRQEEQRLARRKARRETRSEEG